MFKDQKIYLAGHQGLVGSAVLHQLKSTGYTNIITRTKKELDLTIQADVNYFFEQEHPEWVILAAAKVGGILANFTYPADFIKENLLIEANVIDAVWRYDAKKLIFLGSSCIYPKLSPQPIREEYLLTGSLESTNEPYAIAKIAGIKLCQAYNKQYDKRAICLMPTNLYGPNDNFSLDNSHVLPALIRKFHIAKDCVHDEVSVWGTGSPCREFLYVNDLADAIIFMLERKNWGGLFQIFSDGLYNVGTGQDIKIKELAQLIRNIVGTKCTINYDKTKPDGTPRKLLDIHRLNLMGWRAKTPLIQGIQTTYKWYCNELIKKEKLL